VSVSRAAAATVARSARPRRPSRSRLAAIDWPLMIGLLAILALLLVALYGPIIAAHDPFETHAFYKGKVPPLDPSPEFPLGTDALGRDRLSWLLSGARMTFVIALAAAALRVAVGVFLGIFAAVHRGAAERYLSRIALALSSIPATIAACLAVLAFNISAGALAFVLGFSIIGWADAFHHARRAARAELARPYIDSARALGVSEQRLVMAHLLPNLAPNLLTIASLQISAVLLLLSELALLRLFFSGPVSTDLFGTPIVLPSQPEWSSTLGTTRPVLDLFGNSISVLAPGGALLFAVIAFNLFGDALARRAQRLDLFHLFSREQAAVLLASCVVVVTPALLWPGRLANEVRYAESFNAQRALQVAQALTAPPFNDRVAGSAQASAAASWLATELHGTTIGITESVQHIDETTITFGARRLSFGSDLVPLSQASATARGPLMLTTVGTALPRASTGRDLRDAIVLFVNPPQGSLPVAIRLLLQYQAAGLIWATDDASVDAASLDVGIPVVRLAPAHLEELLGQAVPTLGPNDAPVMLGIEAGLDLTIEHLVVSGSDVISRVSSGRADAPVFVVVGPYDQAAYPHYISTRPGWESASAAGVLAAAAAHVQEHGLPADVIFVAAGSESLDHAGLKAALRTLSSDERSRVTGVIVVSNAQGLLTTIRPDLSLINNPGGGPSIAGRIASATGQRFSPQRSQQLQRATVATDLRVPIIELVAVSGTDAPPTLDGLRAIGRTLLVLLDYLAGHPEQLRP
jgi:peptide/nickel transport system permease protein/nickel transport system permease protein